jgi:hypothetical protein
MHEGESACGGTRKRESTNVNDVKKLKCRTTSARFRRSCFQRRQRGIREVRCADNDSTGRLPGN